MTHADPRPPGTIGFLTVLEHEQHGLVGGYLILNLAGRPLEFHCTAPIKPNRAQQILFGPTLEPYLYGEQIGQTLVKKGASEPLVICTDVERAMCVRQFVSTPVALVVAADQVPPVETSPEPPGASWRVDAPHRLGAGLGEFVFGRNRLAVGAQHQGDRQLLAERIESIAAEFDLAEPFERIREAVAEAHQANRS